MNAPVSLTCQRWNSHRASYRPAGEPIDPSKYGVDVVDEARSAKPFVLAHHYEHSFPAARLCIGLFRMRVLVGVCVFSVPCNGKQPAKYSTTKDGADLGRLVLLDDVPANGETWFLARAFRALRREKPSIGAIVSYSDQIERRNADGDLVKPGHVGTIYQAYNATYVGLSKRGRVILDRAGRSVAPRALSKIRNDEQGAAYAYEQLRAAGAPQRALGESGAAYVARALADGPFTSFVHPGKHTYVWRLHDDVSVKVPAKSYPKARAA